MTWHRGHAVGSPKGQGPASYRDIHATKDRSELCINDQRQLLALEKAVLESELEAALHNRGRIITRLRAIADELKGDDA